MKRLLIVDDEVDVQEFAANFFRKRKVQVLTASTGELAVEMAEKYTPHLILLDIKMPGIDGIEALRRIRNKDSQIKVIMVTGKKPEDEESFLVCKNLGALDYVHKPLELDELERVVMKALEDAGDNK